MALLAQYSNKTVDSFIADDRDESNVREMIEEKEKEPEEQSKWFELMPTQQHTCV